MRESVLQGVVWCAVVWCVYTYAETQSWEVKREASTRHSSGNSPLSCSTHPCPALLGRQAGPGDRGVELSQCFWKVIEVER